MKSEWNYDTIDSALARCRASWDAAQAHGFLAGRAAVQGADGGQAAVGRILAECDAADALRVECEALLRRLFDVTRESLAERLSDFAPLLPEDEAPAALRTEALAHWCEGFLHGLVSGEESRDGALRERLAAEPIADIIRDMLEMTRAVAGDDEAGEEEEEAYAEIVEYLRVAAQLVYEELAQTRPVARS